MEEFEAPIFELLPMPGDVLTASPVDGFDTDLDDVGGDTSSKSVGLPVDWF